ncbi:MAG: hypothetical protein OXG37_09620 [Actinomycetia bacterium]|nr:hypothetical protein [Actinomycetes bacterium]
MTTGAATPSLPEAGFWEVELADSSTGWVDSRDLRVPAAWRAPLVEQPCTLTEGLAEGLKELAGKAGSTADHVFALDYGRGDACDRLVVIFGAGGSFANDPPWPHSLAAAVRTGITVLTRAALRSSCRPRSRRCGRPRPSSGSTTARLSSPETRAVA